MEKYTNQRNFNKNSGENKALRILKKYEKMYP